MGANFLGFSKVQIGVRGRKMRPAELTLMSFKTANVGGDDSGGSREDCQGVRHRSCESERLEVKRPWISNDLMCVRTCFRG